MRPNPTHEFYDWLAEEAIEILLTKLVVQGHGFSEDGNLSI